MNRHDDIAADLERQWTETPSDALRRERDGKAAQTAVAVNLKHIQAALKSMPDELKRKIREALVEAGRKIQKAAEKETYDLLPAKPRNPGLVEKK